MRIMTEMMEMAGNLNILKNNSLIIKRIIFLSVLLFIQFHIMLSQQKDFKLWTGVKVKTELFNTVDLFVEEQLRLKSNATIIDKYFTEVGLGYDITDNIDFSIFYRYTRQNYTIGPYIPKHRFYTDLSYKKNIRRFKASLRSRYESKDYVNNDREENFYSGNYSRNKFAVEYAHRKYPLAFSIANEWFYQINKRQKDKFDQVRIEFGLEYIINAKNGISISYKIDNEINVEFPENNYILQIGYSYDW